MLPMMDFVQATVKTVDLSLHFLHVNHGDLYEINPQPLGSAICMLYAGYKNA